MSLHEGSSCISTQKSLMCMESADICFRFTASCKTRNYILPLDNVKYRYTYPQIYV